MEVLRQLSSRSAWLDSSMARRQWQSRLVTLSVALLAVASSFTALANTFVQDDAAIIFSSSALHSLARPWHLFTQSYWPAPYPQNLYRPLTSLGLAVQWAVGGGHPLIFRIVSILLYVLATLAVLALARRVLAPGAAWLAAALFAVDPVHTEAVAVAVNQAELVVAAVIALTVAIYIDHRRAGGRLTPRWIAGLTAACVGAAMFKEHGLMLPAFLVAAELTVISDPRTWRERLAENRIAILSIMLAAVAFVGVRNMVLHGDTSGTFTAEALNGSSMGGRALTMLSVVPRMGRLFVWPAHLQADYSPQEIVAATHWGAAQTLGAIILLGVAMLAWRSRRRRPQITFGVLWIAIGLFPVSNVLVPTGIVLAERTLFLATVGVVLIGGDLLMLAGKWIYERSRIGRLAAAAAIAVILALGITRSALRQRDWHDLFSLWAQTVIDAPRSYRAHFAYAAVLFNLKFERTSEQEYKRALALYPSAWPARLQLADHYRIAGFCYPAISLYHEVLLASPNETDARGSLIACLIYLGRYQEASREARLGAAYGVESQSFRRYEAIADSADRVHAPLHSVKLPEPIARADTL